MMSEDTLLLEKRIEELIEENSRLKSKPRGRIGYFFIMVGLLLFAVSVDFSHQVLPFFSVTFLFLGALFLYIRPKNFLRQDILLSTLNEIASFYESLIISLDYDGPLIYRSPGELSGFSEVYAYIPKTSDLQEFLNGDEWGDETINSDRVKIKPIGVGLTKLMEKEAEVNFASVDIDYLFALIERMLIENLELVKNITMNKNEKTITIRIGYLENAQESAKDRSVISKYITSSLACSLTKCIHRPLIIQDIIIEKDGYEKVTIQIT